MHTSSWAFPNIFNVARNKVNILTDTDSVANRAKLLILSEPMSLYNSPTFGVGLKRHLFQYNNQNQKAIIRDRIKEQLRLHEPNVDADKTSYSDGLEITGSSENISALDYQKLKMTVHLTCNFGEEVGVTVDE